MRTPKKLTVEAGIGHILAGRRDEWLVAPCAGRMNGARQELLPGSAGARQEQRHRAGGGVIRDGQTVFHEPAARDDVLSPIPGCLREARRRHPSLDVPQQFLLAHRLDEETECAALSRLNGLGNGRVGGQYDHRDMGPTAPQFLEQRKPSHILQTQLGDHQIGAGPHAGIQRRLPAFRGAHRIVRAAEMCRHDAAKRGILIYDQYLGLARRQRRSPGGWVGLGFPFLGGDSEAQ